MEDFSYDYDPERGFTILCDDDKFRTPTGARDFYDGSSPERRHNLTHIRDTAEYLIKYGIPDDYVDAYTTFQDLYKDNHQKGKAIIDGLFKPGTFEHCFYTERGMAVLQFLREKADKSSDGNKEDSYLASMNHFCNLLEQSGANVKDFVKVLKTYKSSCMKDYVLIWDETFHWKPYSKGHHSYDVAMVIDKESYEIDRDWEDEAEFIWLDDTSYLNQREKKSYFKQAIVEYLRIQGTSKSKHQIEEAIKYDGSESSFKKYLKELKDNGEIRLIEKTKSGRKIFLYEVV